MLKGRLQKLGQAMMELSIVTCGQFSGLAVTIYAAILAVANAPSISQSFPDDPLQVIMLLVRGGILVAVTIVILAGFFKLITYLFGFALIKLDNFIYRERPARIRFKGNHVQVGERSEFYIQVKNEYWRRIENVNAKILLAQRDGQSLIPFEEAVKWRGLGFGNSVVTIGALKSHYLHFATTDSEERLYINTHRGSLVAHRKPEGYIFSLSIYVAFPNSSKIKSKDFDVIVSYDEYNRAKFKIKEVYREKRHYFSL